MVMHLHCCINVDALIRCPALRLCVGMDGCFAKSATCEQEFSASQDRRSLVWIGTVILACIEIDGAEVNVVTREELYDVAYELGVNPDSLPNASSGAFTREFLLFVTRRGMLPKLQKILKHDRPNVVWPWESSPPEASKQPDTTRLPYRIRSALSNEEFDELVFNLGIDRETLAGTSTLERIVSLVEWARRHGRTDDLMDALRAVRPQVDWTTDLLPGSEAA